MGILLSLGLVSGCDQAATPSAAQEEILVYCGITMVHPIKELARQFEPQLGMKIVVTQDDSGGLYDSLKHSRQGDVYFPGSESFIRQGREEGLLEEGVLIGENPVAFIVAKGNPKRIQPDLKALLRTDVRVVLASESSAIGRLNRRLLEAAGVWEDVLARNVYFATESRNLMQALKQGDADVVLNFRAVGFSPNIWIRWMWCRCLGRSRRGWS